MSEWEKEGFEKILHHNQIKILCKIRIEKKNLQHQIGKFFLTKEITKTKQLNVTNILVYFCILILQYINPPPPNSICPHNSFLSILLCCLYACYVCVSLQSEESLPFLMTRRQCHSIKHSILFSDQRRVTDQTYN